MPVQYHPASDRCARLIELAEHEQGVSIRKKDNNATQARQQWVMVQDKTHIYNSYHNPDPEM